ncbi:MAG: ferritin family protein [Planctomycetota bacterium]|jgi:rubrerythrin
MALQFSAGEVFGMACQIERNGARFYRKVAEAAGSEKGTQTLLSLADMEDEHERTFAQMREELSGQEELAPVYDPDNQAALYLRALADPHVFGAKPDPSAELTGEETLSEILTTAIGLENDSIAFYTGMREAVPASLGKGRIDDIIKEEMGHVVTLQEWLAAEPSG